MDRKATYQKLEWVEETNGIKFDCCLDIALHSSNSMIVLLTVPGVDGSVDGYEDKYTVIAENIGLSYGAAVVRMSNPFISSSHWELNIRKVLNFIEQNSKMIAGRNDFELRIMGHSAGAAVIAQIAWEYPYISRLLLINPATKLGLPRIKQGLIEFGTTKTTILVGSNDQSLTDIKLLVDDKELRALRAEIVEGADHHFSGHAFEVFLKAPGLYLF